MPIPPTLLGLAAEPRRPGFGEDKARPWQPNVFRPELYQSSQRASEHEQRCSGAGSERKFFTASRWSVVCFNAALQGGAELWCYP